MADKINKEESIARVYQFLTKYKGDWKADADLNGDNTIIKAEFRTFLHRADFFGKNKWDGESDQTKEDIITAFWKTIDTSVNGKLNSGKGISNKNALDEKELISVGKNIEATKAINKFMQDKTVPEGIDKKWEAQWKDSVKTGMINRSVEYLKDPNIEELSQDKLTEFFNTSSIKATADYKAYTEIENNKVLNDKELKKTGYTPNDDDTLQGIIDTYVNGLEDSPKDQATILSDVENIIKAYVDTAQTNSQESINLLNQYDYDSSELNPLQIAVIKNEILKGIEKSIDKNSDFYNAYADKINSRLSAFIDKIEFEETDFNKIMDNINTYIEQFKTEELKPLQEQYDKEQRQLQTAREELNTYIGKILDENNVKKTAIIQDEVGTADKSKVMDELKKLKTMEEINALKAKITSELSKLAEQLKAEEAEKAAKRQTSYGELADLLDDIFGDHSGELICGHSEIHTEFGIAKDGTIVFQDSRAKDVYDKLESTVLSEFKTKNPTACEIIGDNDLKKILKSAWIMAYNTFPSSANNRTANFVQAVLNNMEKILNSIKAHPENLAVYTNDTAYANSNLTDRLIHYNTNTTYGDDELIDYGGTVRTDSDGTVHIENTYDDPDYQATMNALLSKILKTEPYKNINSNTITNIFREAQQEALRICINNISDCPYGTDNGGRDRVEDADNNRDWYGGGDTRDGDSSYIDMDELVQLTLYCFDRLLYKKLAE